MTAAVIGTRPNAADTSSDSDVTATVSTNESDITYLSNHLSPVITGAVRAAQRAGDACDAALVRAHRKARHGRVFRTSVTPGHSIQVRLRHLNQMPGAVAELLSKLAPANVNVTAVVTGKITQISVCFTRSSN